MNLLEHQGKALLKRHGVPVPEGTIWPELPRATGPYVVKAQVAAGGRARGGGIQFAPDAASADRLARELIGGCIANHAVQAVYVEPELDIVKELYLAVTVDRDSRSYAVLASQAGGIDVEREAPADLVTELLDPLAGLRPGQADRVARAVAPHPTSIGPVATAIAGMYRLAVYEDAHMVEVNPLAVLADGGVVAGDAKVVLDGRAAFRHPQREDLAPATTRTPLEEGIAATGAVGIEVDPEGDTLVAVSGAGLMMASLDLLADRGVRVRCAIDLAGTVLAGETALRQVFEAAAEVAPRLTYLNVFAHTAKADEFARALAAAHAARALPGHVLIRLKGRGSADGRRLLAPLGFELHEDLEPSVAAVGRHISHQ